MMPPLVPPMWDTTFMEIINVECSTYNTTKSYYHVVTDTWTALCCQNNRIDELKLFGKMML